MRDMGLKVPTTTRFTPGPWYADDETVLAGRERVAVVVPWTRGIHLANARLIAAAPELYAALRELIDAVVPGAPIEIQSHAPIYERARSALTKAEGSLEPAGQPEDSPS